MKIADIHNYKNGKKRVDFFHLGVYDLIRNELGYRYKKVNGKGYYFHRENGLYKKVSFYKVDNAFYEKIKADFEKLEIDGEIEYIDFLNAYHRKEPVKNGRFAKNYLSQDFELNEQELHLLKLQTDNKYYNKHIEHQNKRKLKEMLAFIKNEEFKLTNELFGNFFSANGKVYYKPISKMEYLLFYYPDWNIEKNEPVFDLFKVKAKNETDLFKKRNSDIKDIILGFSLNRDLELYKKEKRVATPYIAHS